MCKPSTSVYIILGALLAIALAGGCGGSGPEPTPTPTKTPISSTASQPANTPAPAAQAAKPTPPPATPASAAAPTAAPSQTIVVVNADQVNVRSEPNTEGSIVATVNTGQKYTLIGRNQDNTWLQVGENGKEIGWIFGEFADIQTGAPAAQAGDQTTTTQQTGQAAPATGSGTYAPITMSSPDYGTQAFLWWDPEITRRDLDLIKDAGFTWVKQAFAWETIEGAGKGQFDWSKADITVTEANQRNIKILARLSSDPTANFWAAGNPPQNADNFADYVFALATRYNCSAQAVGCIQAYQVWNEPNLAREWGGNQPNPAQYVAFLQKAYAAIKRGNPQAIVISAGMAPTGDNNAEAMADDLFYEGMYQAMNNNSTGYFDMLGVHGAGFAAPPELDPAEAASNPKYGGYRFFAFRHVEDIRALMVKHGDTNKQIVLLEFGWTTDSVNAAYKWHGADAGITDAVQADYLKRAYVYAKANWQPWIGLMSLLTMPNLAWMDSGNPEGEEQYWWAIMRPSRISKLKFRNAYIELCIYFNGLNGQKCKYDPN
ncbi:hypothetical protein BH10CHL1_BH10CHL1_07030 [soil metagenome]